MRIGNNSNVYYARKGNVKVWIQYDKLYRICDVSFPTRKKPLPNLSTKPDKIAEHKEAMKAYQASLEQAKAFRSDFLNTFRGRQINDSLVIYKIDYYLSMCYEN